MTKTIKLAIIGAVLAVGIAQSKAQTTNGTLTNVLMSVAVKATAYVQSGDGTVTKTRLTTKDIISRIETDLGTQDRRNKLVFAFPLPVASGEAFPTTDLVRLENGTDVVPLGAYFNFFRSEDGPAVSDIKPRKRAEYSVWRVSFATVDASFEAQGFGVFTQSGDHSVKGTITGFSGFGAVGGNAAVVSGSATFGGKKIETIAF
jgi:hypothetical protein